MFGNCAQTGPGVGGTGDVGETGSGGQSGSGSGTGQGTGTGADNANGTGTAGGNESQAGPGNGNGNGQGNAFRCGLGSLASAQLPGTGLPLWPFALGGILGMAFGLAWGRRGRSLAGV